RVLPTPTGPSRRTLLEDAMQASIFRNSSFRPTSEAFLFSRVRGIRHSFFRHPIRNDRSRKFLSFRSDDDLVDRLGDLRDMGPGAVVVITAGHGLVVDVREAA